MSNPKSRSTAKPKGFTSGPILYRMMYAKLLRIASAPEYRISGRRKRLLERQLFQGSETARAAYGERFFRTATEVVSAWQVRDPEAFVKADDELTALWQEYLAARPGFGIGAR